MSRKSQNELNRRLILLCATLLTLTFLFYNRDSATTYMQRPTLRTSGLQDQTLDIALPNLAHDTHLPCANLPGAEDILVVVKTGYNVAHKRLPMHLQTTYRCIPNVLLYSDAEDEVDGHRVHDILADIDPEIVDNHDDFRFYRRVRESQAQGLSVSDFQSQDDADDAWRLDKWKFIPSLVKAAEHMPEAKWYIFIEADTYLVWSNLLQWLGRKNHKKRLYLGSQAWIGDTVFAHGGSGYVLSSAALKATVKEIDKDRQKYYAIPDTECCGDVAISVLLRDHLNLNLTASWPMIQGETPETLDYTQDKWCKTVVSYHHVDADEVDALWRFEQHWLQWMSDQERLGRPGGLAPPILHRDIYDYFVSPLIQTPLMDWDNMSRDRVLRGARSGGDGDNIGEEGDENRDDQEDHTDYRNDEEKVAHTSFAACRRACDADGDCLTYSYMPGECRLGHVIRLGTQAKAEKRIRSGWMTERIDQLKRGWECEDD